MPPLIRKCSVLLLLALAGAVAQNTPDPKPPDPVPIPQMAPEELPAKAPRVIYRDGELLIDADNASLADVLNAISTQTGAEIDKPSNIDSERVVIHAVGPPHRVIAELLDGGKFGYIILSPPENPSAVQKLIVTRETQAESRPGPSSQAVNRLAAATPQEPGPTPEFQRAEGADRDGDAAASAPVSAATQSQPLEGQRTAAVEEPVRPVFSGSDAQKSADPAQNPGPTMMQQGKPPMEVLQDLYRMRQQQVQQQNQAGKPPQQE